MAMTLEEVKQAFESSDVDKDGHLKMEEFMAYVKVIYKKDCPPQMYTSLCKQLKVEADAGLTWSHCKAVFMQSQKGKNKARQSRSPTITRSKSLKPGQDIPQRATTPQPGPVTERKPDLAQHAKSPQPPAAGSGGAAPSGELSPSRLLARSKTHAASSSNILAPKRAHGKNSSLNLDHALSPALSGLTEGALRRHEIDMDDQMSVASEMDMAGLARQRSHRHTRTASRVQDLQEKHHGRRESVASDQSSSEVQILSMMESKLNNTKKELNRERQSRKQFEDLTKQLLSQNEQYKEQIKDLNTQLKRAKAERQRERGRMEQHVRELEKAMAQLKTHAQNDKTTITHLETRANTMKSERDEAFKLLRAVEKEHEARVKKLKAKQKDNIERISNGFLQSIGVNPGDDVREVVSKLRNERKMLQKQVDVLAEQLSRKDQSLLEALRAVDEVNLQNDSLFKEMSVTVTPDHDAESSQRRRSVFGRRNSKSAQHLLNGVEASEEKTHSGEEPQQPAFPQRSRRASFFKNASTGDPFLLVQSGHNPVPSYMLGATSKGISKELQFVTQRLAKDAADKQDVITNMQAANAALGSQVANLQEKLRSARASAASTPTSPDKPATANGVPTNEKLP